MIKNVLLKEAIQALHEAEDGEARGRVLRDFAQELHQSDYEQLVSIALYD